MKPEMREWLLEHHKAAYVFEFERSDRLWGRISLLSGLFTVLGGALSYTGSSYPYSWHGGLSLLFYIPAGLSLLFFIIAVVLSLYCLGRGFQYEHILSPQELQDYAEAIDAYAAAVPAEKVDAVADLKDHMIEAYCAGATHNLGVNKRRYKVLLRATQIAICSFVLLLSALPRFFVDSSQEHAEPRKVMVSEPVRTKP